MEDDAATRYRSRILREMKANRENPFNSPPSSTGSHGTVTLSSIFSEPEGESTRKLNEDIARVTGPRKVPVNWEAAHRKWPEFYGMPKNRDALGFEINSETRPMSAESKENKPPASHAAKYNYDDTTQETWMGSNRTRAQMQPRVDNESDMSSLLPKSPARALARNHGGQAIYKASPLAKGHTRTPSAPERQVSLSQALERYRRTSPNAHTGERKEERSGQESPHLSSARSSLTAVQMSPRPSSGRIARSFVMPDVSHLGDFVEGTLQLSGSNSHGVPVFVKHGRVHDRKEKRGPAHHADVDGLEVPQDEEKIFISMDMIREEILSLQEHYDKIQDYADSLQQQVEQLEAQLRSRKSGETGFSSEYANQQLLAQKNRLEVEVVDLRSRLEEASCQISTNGVQNDALVQERDRAVQKLQEACDDISKLSRKLSCKEKELETSQRQKEPTEKLRETNDILRRDLISLKHGRDALELENNSLREENNKLRRNNQSLIIENTSLRENLDSAQDELDTAREELQHVKDELANLRGDNQSLVRHNEKYFRENKILRRETSSFERGTHDLHEENARLKLQVQGLKEQLDARHPSRRGSFSPKLNDETEDNMTSAFFVQDITVNTSNSRPVEGTETEEMPPPPELTSQSTNLTSGLNAAEQDLTTESKRDDLARGEEPVSRRRSKSRSRQPSQPVGPSQRVSFSMPEKTNQSSKGSSTVANQGSKRRSASQSSRQAFPRQFLPDSGEVGETEDLTGWSAENTTQMRQHAEVAMQRAFDATAESNAKPGDGESCPALSNEARRILEGLCEHNCHNCTVCTRIASHRGLLSSAQLAHGKKRVTVPRPVPVTDRELTGEDQTMRPARSPGHALAIVIKGLEDEARHLQLNLSSLQAQYSRSDKAHGRRERLRMAEGIRTLLKRLEAKNDQIYSLYDVLEGQKAADQAMTEEEIELTVLNITGMTIRDVTSNSEDLSWNGIQE